MYIHNMNCQTIFKKDFERLIALLRALFSRLSWRFLAF